jgi:hypothetical protein
MQIKFGHFTIFFVGFELPGILIESLTLWKLRFSQQREFLSISDRDVLNLVDSFLHLFARESSVWIPSADSAIANYSLSVTSNFFANPVLVVILIEAFNLWKLRQFKFAQITNFPVELEEFLLLLRNFKAFSFDLTQDAIAKIPDNENY